MLGLSLFLMVQLNLSGCGSVSIKEEDFYTDAHPNGAILSHFYDTTISYIGDAAWDQLREGMICISADTFGDLKTEIEQLCSDAKCDKSVQKKLAQAEENFKRAGISAKALREGRIP